MFKLKISITVLLIFMVLGCENTTEVEDNKESITVSGTLENISIVDWT